MFISALNLSSRNVKQSFSIMSALLVNVLHSLQGHKASIFQTITMMVNKVKKAISSY